MADRTVSVSLIAKVQGYVAGIGTAVKATKQFGGELDKLGKNSPKKFNDITQALTGAGLALAAVAGYAIKSAMDFDKAMSAVSAVSNATVGDLKSLREAALQAGKDTAYSATQAAQAEEELAKAGVSTKDILQGGLTGALSLAAAGQIDLADAATYAAQAMNVFHLSGKDVGHIADVLANGANKSAADIHDLALGMQQAGNVASSLGWTLDETTGILAAFADRGLRGSDAGTSLKTMLMRLMAPTKKAAELMDQLGIKVYDASGNFVGAAEVAGQLQKGLSGLNQEQKNQTLVTLFGSDAIRAATIAYDLGADGVKKYTSEMGEAGAAQRTAAEKTNNLAGDMERLRGTIQTLAISSGSGANGGLRALVQALDGLLGKFLELPGPVQSAVTVIAGLSGAGLLATAGLLKTRQVTQEAMIALEAMGPAGEKAAAGLGKLGSIAGKATLWGIALLAAFEGAKAFIGFLNSDVQPAKRNVDEMTRALKELADTGKVTGELQKAFGEGLRDLPAQAKAYEKALNELNDGGLRNTKDGLADLGHAIVGQQKEMSGLNDAARKSINQFRENVGATDAALAALVNNGGATQAKLAFDQLREVWVASGHDLGELNALFPQYAQAAAGVAAANSSMGQGFGSAEQNARTLKQGLGELIAAGQTVIDVFNQLNGSTLAVSDAEIAAEAGARNLTAALKESHNSLDITTEKGAAARSALNDLARKAAEAAQAVYDQTQSADAAAAEFEKYRQKMIDAAVAAGMARSEAEKLANQLFQLPKSIPIDINVTTHYSVTGKPPVESKSRPGSFNAQGGTVDFYAGGGENHRAQIAPANSWRVWGEAETGGEGYIPLSAMKRQQAISTLSAINRRFGDPLGGQRQVGAIDLAPLLAEMRGLRDDNSKLRAALSGMAVFLDNERVGSVQGRQADRYRRGG